MSWILLFIAGLLEVAWAAGLKSSEGFTRLGPSIFTLITAIGSFVLLAMAMRQLPLGTAYAVWTGIGAVGAFVFGIVYHGRGFVGGAYRERDAHRRGADRAQALVGALNAHPLRPRHPAVRWRTWNGIRSNRCCTALIGVDIMV